MYRVSSGTRSPVGRALGRVSYQREHQPVRWDVTGGEGSVGTCQVSIISLSLPSEGIYRGHVTMSGARFALNPDTQQQHRLSLNSETHLITRRSVGLLDRNPQRRLEDHDRVGFIGACDPISPCKCIPTNNPSEWTSDGPQCGSGS